MTVIALYPAFIALIGALVYFVACEGTSRSKAAELGRIAFACGLVVLAYSLASHVLRVG